MFSVQFLITKKWRGPFFHGSDVNGYSGIYPTEEMNFMHMCLVLNNEWYLRLLLQDSSPRTDSAKKAPRLSEPCVYLTLK